MKSRYRPAFTLIELLVVIAIMGLLLSIILPSLSGARKQGKRLVCMSHLRELSHGWHMYADENKDVCLPGRYGNEPGGKTNPLNWYEIGNGLKFRPRWIATMGRQVGIFAFDQPSTTDDRQDYDSVVYQCPTASQWIDERNHAFGYNHHFLGNARKTAGQFHNFPVIRSRIVNTSGMVMATDCLGTAAGLPRDQRKPYHNNGTDFAELGNHGWTLDPPRLTAVSDRGSGDAGSPRTSVDPRHEGKANAIFCDGHAEARTPQQFGYRILPSGAYVDLEPAEDPPTNRWFTPTGRDDAPPAIPTP